MSRRILSLASLVLIASLPLGFASAEASTTPPVPAPRPKVALVLGGGGARGAAHIGVLKVLHELRVPYDVITGTSMGSIVGGMRAAGLTPEELEHELLAIDWADIFNDAPRRQMLSYRRKQDDEDLLFRLKLRGRGLKFSLPGGLVSGQKLGYTLNRLTLRQAGVTDFDQLPIPFRCVATDVVAGSKVVLGEGDLARAIRASMSFPGAFDPVVVGNLLLVDGGIKENLPVETARGLGAEVVLAVNVGEPLYGRDALGSLFSITAQVTGFLTNDNVKASIASLHEGRDVLMVPKLEGISFASFTPEALQRAIQDGVDAARKVESELRRYSVSEAEYAAFLQRTLAPERETIVINGVSFEGDRGAVDDRMLLARLQTKPGRPLDLDVLRRDLERLYEIDAFDRIDFSLVKADKGRFDLVYTLVQRRAGSDYIKMGLNLSSNLSESGTFVARSSYTKTLINRYGAEWRTLVSLGDENGVASEFYQPLGWKGQWFVAPHVSALRSTTDVTLDRRALARFRLSTYEAGLSIGRQFGRYGEFRVGVAKTSAKADALISLLPFPTQKVSYTAFLASATYDQLDSTTFPRRGTAAQASVRTGSQALGAETDYTRGQLNLIQVATRGRNTISVQFAGGSAFGDTLPLYDYFELGGFGQLAGFAPGELSGDRFMLGSLLLYRQFATLPTGLGEGLYYGVWLEAGDAWERPMEFDAKYAVSVLLGADTILGPLYLGYGRATGGRGAAYLFLGQTF